MPIFKYRGKNKVGSIIEGERSARSASEVVAALEKEQIQALSVERKKLKVSIPFIGGRKSV
jgi:type II secretory pathway component PulF